MALLRGMGLTRLLKLGSVVSLRGWHMIFTVDEANNLIPWLSEVFESIEPLQLKVENLAFEMAMLKQRVSSNGGSSVEDEVKNLESLINENTQRIKTAITEVLDRGIIENTSRPAWSASRPVRCRETVARSDADIQAGRTHS